VSLNFLPHVDHMQNVQDKILYHDGNIKSVTNIPKYRTNHE